MMVVDDEEIIVDGLYELLSQVNHMELEVHRAYSSREALLKLNQLKMDIVFSDIRMPGLNGLQLQQIIHDNWPYCKVIFISGYNDFEYVQAAIRNGSFDYIVKTEGDEKVLEALDKAVVSISGQMEQERFLEVARQRWMASIPLLQKAFLLRILLGERKADAVKLKHRFEELDISLSADLPVYILAGRIDAWPEGIEKGDRTLLVYAMENIASEYFQQYAVYLLDSGHDRICVLLQQRNSAEGEGSEGFLVSFVQGTMDAIQGTFKQLLKVPVSMIFSPRPVCWESLAEKYRELVASLYRRFGWEKETLLIDDSLGAAKDRVASPKRRRDEWLYTTQQIGFFLESGQREECMKACGALIQEGVAAQDCPREWLVEVYYAAAMQLVRFMNNYDRSLDLRFSLERLLRLQQNDSWQEAMDYLSQAAESLFDRDLQEHGDKSMEWILRLHRYVEEHLAEDLSLTRLGEVVFLSPAYLSRIYKQSRGIGLSDYVTQIRLTKAQHLLKDTSMKVQEIAEAVGFESAAYFSRLFKKVTHLTPNEFREQVLSNRTGD